MIILMELLIKKKAKNMLNKCDLTGYKDFLPHVSKIISDILAYDDCKNKKLRIKKITYSCLK